MSVSVLYIDDDEDLRDIAALALDGRDELQVTFAGSGEEGVTMVESGECRPDLVVLDVRMPGLDGPATYRRLRSLPGTDHVRYAYVSASADANVDLVGAGVVDVIEKPFDLETFADDILALAAG